MKTKWMTLATLALALSPSLALASAPKPAPPKPVQSNGTRQQNANQYHDRTPQIHERGSGAPR